MTNRNQSFGNEEERYGSTVLRTNWRPGTSGNQSKHGKAMNSEKSTSSGEKMQETDENKSVIPEHRNRDPRNMSLPNGDRNGNGKSQLNLKYKGKTEYCGTHTRKTREKGDSTKNNIGFGQENSTVSVNSPQRHSNEEVSKNKNIMDLQSDSSQDDSKDENKTIPKVAEDSIEEASSGKDIVHSTKKALKNTDIANFQSMNVDLKENSICKGTVSSEAVPVENGENKEAVWNSNENSSKCKVEPVEINDNECDVFPSAAKHSSSDNSKKLQDINKRSSNQEHFATEETAIAKGYDATGEDFSVDKNFEEDEDLQVDENVAEDESEATAGTVAEHSFPGNDNELQGINECKLDEENLAVVENVEADDSIATNENVAAAGTVAEHSSPDSGKESQEISGSDKTVAADNSNSSEEEEQKLSENRPLTHYSNSVCLVPGIAKTVPKVLSSDFDVPISEFCENNSVKEKLLEANTYLIPIVPISSNFKGKNNKIKLVPKQDCTAPEVFGPAPTVSNAISETSVFSTNEDSPKTLRETLPPAKTDSFDEKPLIPKSLMTSSIPHSSNPESFMDMKPLSSMQSMKSNQLIYKLAYNESLTSSETNSRSLSPVDPESQVPSSIVNDEIIVHEADTDSDAGSEDVELIPHRYECETSLNRNKNVYVNKLSLAVELLRTQESLPYDDNFKRVVEDTEDTVGETNFGFEEDSTSFNTSKGQGREVVVSSPSKSSNLLVNIPFQCKSKATSSDDDEKGFNDSCEEAEEMAVGATLKQRDATTEVKAANRRYQVHLRHYFSPRVMTNPCLCCVIM